MEKRNGKMVRIELHKIKNQPEWCGRRSTPSVRGALPPPPRSARRVVLLKLQVTSLDRRLTGAGKGRGMVLQTPGRLEPACSCAL